MALIFQIIPSLNAYNQMYREIEESTFDLTAIQVILKEIFPTFSNIFFVVIVSNYNGLSKQQPLKT